MQRFPALIRPVTRSDLVTPELGPAPLTLALDGIMVAAMSRVSGTSPPPGQLARELLTHSGRDGFRCLVAFVQEEANTPARPTGAPPGSAWPGRPVGFTYGYTGRRGQWWTDQVARHLDPERARVWLSGHFELAELHVHPSYQGRGIGGELHDRLLEGLPHTRALLSTRQAPTVAIALYRSRGWRLVVGPIHFNGAPDPYLILGKELEPGAGG